MMAESLFDNLILWFQPITALMISLAIVFYLAVRYRKEKIKVLEQTRQLAEYNQRLRQAYEDLHQTQQRLVESEKMAAIGQLIAGVTHELNNPISVILTNMYPLRQYIDRLKEVLHTYETFPLKSEFQQKIAELKKQNDFLFIHRDLTKLIDAVDVSSQRVRRIVANLQEVSRMEATDLQIVDLRVNLKNTVHLLHNQYKTRITFHEEYEEIPEMYCFPEQVTQVFMNLLVNACQAIPDRGNVWVRMCSRDGQIEISIRDDGSGIPEPIQNKIFDPFFTTKKVGEGTGLGLSLSYRIIQKHLGEIRVKSQPGNGAEFLIRLPVKKEKYQPDPAVHTDIWFESPKTDFQA